MEANGTDTTEIEEVAEKLTESTIKAAIKHQKEAEFIIKNIQWATCQDFTVDLGRQQIEEYILTWEMHESWLHWSEYLQEEELEYTIRYCYRVKWSIPTCRKPIPRAIACVYFFIDLSKIKPAVSTFIASLPHLNFSAHFVLVTWKNDRKGRALGISQLWTSPLCGGRLLCSQPLALLLGLAWWGERQRVLQGAPGDWTS
uniref:A-kinase anchoring protein 14 n=1 Tax=Ornithorhynchus anatinus TaxID=9258 RepID=A0A6I8NB74_ORNAN